MKSQTSFYEKDSIIFRVGEPVTGIHFVLEGKVKVEMPLGNNNFILRLSNSGDILGHRGIGIDDIYRVQAVALEPTTICFLPLGFFFKIMRANPDFHLKLTFFLAEELKRTETRMAHLTNMPVKARVAEAILLIREAYGFDKIGALNHCLSKKDMASIAGTNPDTLNRNLNELVKEKLITLLGTNIIVQNVNQLESSSKGLA